MGSPLFFREKNYCKFSKAIDGILVAYFKNFMKPTAFTLPDILLVFEQRLPFILTNQWPSMIVDLD